MPRTIRLRYPGSCSVCSTDLPRGTQAWWDSAAKKAWCEEHGETPPVIGAVAPPSEIPATPLPDVGGAPPPAGPRPRGDDILGTRGGGSALAEYERRKTAEENRIREDWSRFPRVANLLVKVTDETKDTAAWGKGGRAEAALSERLGRIPGVRVLHDRLKPGSKTGNIDHLVVSANAVWVIDAKAYSGKVEIRNKGTLFRPVEELRVNGRNQEKLVTGVVNQAAAVEKILAPTHPGVRVRPALCFVDADWEPFAPAVEHRGVVISRPKKLYPLLEKPGPLDAAQIESVHALLARSLRPAVQA